MARIYSHDGYIAADGLQGCTVCDEALIAARRLADEWDEPVELEDDDGAWYVFPRDATGVRPGRVEVAGDGEPDDGEECR